MNKLTNTLGITALASTLLVACSSTPIKLPVAPAPIASAPVHSAPVIVPTPAVPVAKLDPLNDPNSILAKRSIFFDFDQYNVKPEFDALNTAQAKYLVDHGNRTIVVQGNTDNRGGREYNLALGQKRAEAEAKVLIAFGVNSSRIEAVSFGKEEPKATGNNEAAWAENRRDDIVYN